jgi:hypothetical protein
MNRTEQIAESIQAGTDLIDVRFQTGLTVARFIDHVWRAIGKGQLRVSDVLCVMDADVVDYCWNVTEDVPTFDALSQRFPHLSEDDGRLISEFARPSRLMGEVYETLRGCELALFAVVVGSLKHEYGEHEGGWWMKMPQKVRVDCFHRRDADLQHQGIGLAEERYLDLTDLVDVFEKNSQLLGRLLPKAARKEYKAATDELRTVVRLRNRFAHPLREETLGMDDFLKLQRVQGRLGEMLSRLSAIQGDHSSAGVAGSV